MRVQHARRGSQQARPGSRCRSRCATSPAISAPSRLPAWAAGRARSWCPPRLSRTPSVTRSDGIPVGGTVEPGHVMGASAPAPPALHRPRPALDSLERTEGTAPALLPDPGGSLSSDVFTSQLGLPATWVLCCYPYPTCAPARPRRAPLRRPRPPRTTPHGRTAPGHRRAALPLTRTPVPPGARQNSITCPARHSPRRRQTAY